MSLASADAPALTRREHRRLAGALLKAASERRALAPLSERFPELTLGDAAQIRDTAVVSRIAAGERLIGAKAALAGTGEPCLGWLTDGMRLPSGAVAVDDLINPRVEAKIGFVVDRPLRASVGSVADLLAVTARVVPCLEVLDARFDGAAIEPVDAIADNCAAARLLCGPGVPPPDEADMLRVGVRLGGAGLPAADRGEIIDATLWLANRVVEEGGELEAGAMLVSPACTPAVALRPGSRVHADFRALGALSLRVAR
jgi:2-keto-4-pentenoate hydratase